MTPTEHVVESAPAGQQHDGFISYSRKDAAFAAKLQKALEKYTPPKELGHRGGRLRVFRDQQDFTGTEYFTAIEMHLARARKLIVICSPAAAASRYVDDEIDRFVKRHGATNVVPVLWQGVPNNEATEDQSALRAFPPALCHVLQMPLAVDFRGFNPAADRVDGAAHFSAWTTLLANLLDVSRSDVEQRELLRRRRVRRAWTAGIGSVFASLLTLTIWALFEGERALARQLAAQAAIRTALDSELVERRVLLAREASYRLARIGQATLDADTALRDALAHTPRRRLVLPAGERVMAFSGDGEHLLVAQGQQLAIHPLSSSSPPRTIALPRPLHRLVASADLRFVAGVDEGGSVRAWSWPDFTPIAAMPPAVSSAPVQCLAFSEHGATVVALRVITNPKPGAELLRWRFGESGLIESASIALPKPAREAPGDDCLFARDHGSSLNHAVGAMLTLNAASEAEASNVALRWPLRSSSSFALSIGKTDEIRAWPGGVAVELDQNAHFVLLLPSGEVMRDSGLKVDRIRAVPKWSRAVALAKGGGWLATAQFLEDPVVPLLKSTRFDLIDTNTGTVMGSVADHGGTGMFTPDGATFVTVAGTRLRLWDRRDGRERLRLFTAAPTERVIFDLSSRQLAAVAADGAIEVYDIGGADETLRSSTIVVPFGSAANALMSSGRRLLLPSGVPGTLPSALPLDGHFYSARASPDGRWLAIGTNEKEQMIKLGEPPELTLTLVEITADGPVVRHRGTWGRHQRFDRDARHLFVVGEDGHARMLNLMGAQQLWEHRIDPSKPTAFVSPGQSRYAVALSDDATVAAVGGLDGFVAFSGRDGTIRQRRDTPATALALSADGRLLARAAGEGVIEVLRVADGEVMVRLDRRGVGSIRELMFSPGARMLMAIGGTSYSTFMVGGLFSEEHFMVWDLRSGAPVVRVPDSRLASGEYQASVGATADERMQLTGIVWNVHTQEVAGTMFPSLLAYFSVPSSMVRGNVIAWRLTDEGLVETYRSSNAESLTLRGFAARGGAVVASGEDRINRLIDLSSSRLVAVSCAAVRRPMAAAERQAHLGSWIRRPMICDASVSRSAL